jgi:hypothetical protein
MSDTDDHWHFRRVPLRSPDQFQPLNAGHVDLSDQQIVFIHLQFSDRLKTILDAGCIDIPLLGVGWLCLLNRSYHYLR